jgi:predicted DNA-binding transcriptional regulator YafY
MSSKHWRPADIDRLERAMSEGARVQLMRRGTEYVVIPRSLVSEGAREVLVATTTTGDDLRFRLDEIEYFSVIWQ